MTSVRRLLSTKSKDFVIVLVFEETYAEKINGYVCVSIDRLLSRASLIDGSYDL